MIEKRYDSKTIEKKWLEYWNENKAFCSKPDSRVNFTMILPPPNVTGSLHMGHALNATFQDIIARYKRMMGYNVCWVPGTDHAGIATQNVVERELLANGTSRHEIGKEAFLQKVFEWKERKGGYIINQLKLLGASCDWDREKFTMDETSSDWVKIAFVDLYNKGLIYKGKYIVNWCPRCTTALADDEVNYDEIDSHMYNLRYYRNDGSYVVVATTRPETILGDTAVAYYPSDTRFTSGDMVKVPLVDRYIPLLPDHMVKKDFGTGLVKLTPAHDKNDFAAGKRLGIDTIKIIDDEGFICNSNSKYDGMDRFECREEIVKDMEASGLIESVDPYKKSIGKCYRCSTIVEPYLSDQIFVKMEPLCKKALDLVENGDIKLVPDIHNKLFKNWMTNTNDWCISRQIWWGHRIPLYTCTNCDRIECSIDKPKCSECGSDTEQISDVLDTWFSSWLWAFSVFDNDLDYYYPTDVLMTGADILFFWVARMIMASKEFLEKPPFKQVYLHGIVRDENGDKMSKSKGNAIDPLTVINQYSADILRFTLAMSTPKGQDVGVSMKSFNVGMQFCTKYWNSVRYCLMYVENISTYCESDLTDIDKWIMNRFNNLIDSISHYYDNFDFQKATTEIYSFIWDDFCNCYLEMIKYKLSSNTKDIYGTIIYDIVSKITKLLHPTIPFITEEIWEKLCELSSTNHNSLTIEEWPTKFSLNYNTESDKHFEVLRDVISSFRNIKTEYGVSMKEKSTDFIVCDIGNSADYLNKNSDSIQQLTNYNTMKVYPDNVDLNLLYSTNGDIRIYIDSTSRINVDNKISVLENRKAKLMNKINKLREDVLKCKDDQIKKVKKLEGKIEASMKNIDQYNDQIDILRKYKVES